MTFTDDDLKRFVIELEKTMHCNCDLDNWEPEKLTGHSCVCRIHKQAIYEAWLAAKGIE